MTIDAAAVDRTTVDGSSSSRHGSSLSTNSRPVTPARVPPVSGTTTTSTSSSLPSRNSSAVLVATIPSCI
jgi:hypothetical protein